MEMSSLARCRAQENIQPGVTNTPISSSINLMPSPVGDTWASSSPPCCWRTVLDSVPRPPVRQHRTVSGTGQNHPQEPPPPHTAEPRRRETRGTVGIPPRLARDLSPGSRPPVCGQQTPPRPQSGAGGCAFGRLGTNGCRAGAKQGPESAEDRPQRVRQEIHNRQSRTGSHRLRPQETIPTWTDMSGACCRTNPVRGGNVFFRKRTRPDVPPEITRARHREVPRRMGFSVGCGSEIRPAPEASRLLFCLPGGTPFRLLFPAGRFLDM